MVAITTATRSACGWPAAASGEATCTAGTDDFGYKSVTDVVTVHDLHATILAALGLDHVGLTFPHDGRADSLTDHEVTKARVVRRAAGVRRNCTTETQEAPETRGI